MPNCGILNGKSFHVLTGFEQPACLCDGRVIGPEDPEYRDPNIELDYAEASALFTLAQGAGYGELACRLHDHAQRVKPVL